VFAASGKQVVIFSAFWHGVPDEHWQLSDTKTGACLGAAHIDHDAGKISGTVPAWAKLFIHE
jgi:hypothetical protein